MNVFCVGREILQRNIVTLATKHGSVLLFGGRQSGKTTILRKICQELSSPRIDRESLSSVDIAVYVDLMRLPVDAAASDFFHFLATSAVDQCSSQIDGFNRDIISPLDSKIDPLSSFSAFLSQLKISSGEVEMHLIFLLDEAKRVLGDRFGRGFQDNLFALLYGEEDLRPIRISMVFAGSQHLYKLSEDDTSPIASRAAPVHLCNLNMQAVHEIIARDVEEECQPNVSERIHQLSGGHAGLSRRMAEHRPYNSLQDVEQASAWIAEHSRPLFDNWISSLTTDALCIAQALASKQKVSISEAASILDANGHNRFHSHRALDELCFTGISVKSNGSAIRSSEIFWEYFNSFIPDSNIKPSTNETWRLIEAAELLLREIVRSKYEEHFGENYQDKMKSVLGEISWSKIEAVRDKSSRQYPLSKGGNEREIMSCMYIGDLQSLILSNSAWAQFRDLFRDKRQLEDLIRAIAPVRNDRAHFSQVPAKELERCRIACDDLIVILEKSERIPPAS
ncbi:hypothetical protein [Stenotrophomonas forensis]|uniref:AAA+ ATPase domain-containing protein n=1 Tax=Stenotrophomonas forensis TaxID=2871169 RepID=A0ABY7XYC5_9GAMM|nr:hypothetical protein [Stenotrophomonas sp. DFS-20110405]WDM62741.1 hypothetical protein K5L94_16765 [Stenotrophomonas sp. DFS-20110405]